MPTYRGIFAKNLINFDCVELKIKRFEKSRFPQNYYTTLSVVAFRLGRADLEVLATHDSSLDDPTVSQDEFSTNETNCRRVVGSSLRRISRKTVYIII